jgi:hypothetical protein
MLTLVTDQRKYSQVKFFCGNPSWFEGSYSSWCEWRVDLWWTDMQGTWVIINSFSLFSISSCIPHLRSFSFQYQEQRILWYLFGLPQKTQASRDDYFLLSAGFIKLYATHKQAAALFFFVARLALFAYVPLVWHSEPSILILISTNLKINNLTWPYM